MWPFGFRGLPGFISHVKEGRESVQANFHVAKSLLWTSRYKQKACVCVCVCVCEHACGCVHVL